VAVRRWLASFAWLATKGYRLAVGDTACDAAYFVVCEILEQRCSCGMSEEYSQHFLTGIRQKLLSVPGVGHWLSFLGIATISSICQ